ncbi:MAG: acyl-CoA/acyl-ACP dehydrogenase [Chloroflexi bacterium]|nr:acyl-CoA/acyl-ACP dehydrogenase [Chloroflexota bacterium]
MDFQLSPELKALQDKVRQFVNKELLPLEVEVELADGRLDPAVRARLQGRARELGLNGFALPRALGGQGFNWLAQVVVSEEIGKVTNGLGFVIPDPAIVFAVATPEQVERYVRPATDPNLGDGNTLFFVDLDSSGVEVIEHPRYMHHLIAGHLKIALRNVRVPQANVLGEVGQGLSLSKEWFRRERIMIAARCVGAAERLIGEASHFAQSRVQFGQPISEYQAIQFMLADSLTEAWAARLMTYAVAQAADEAKTEEEVKLVHAKASMAKLYASEMVGRVADRAVQIFGGRGYMRENVAERYYREVRVERIWEGTSEIQRIIIAYSLYKRGVPAHIE